MPETIAEQVAEETAEIVSEISEAVETIAENIIEEQAEKIVILEEINEAIIDAAIEKEANAIEENRFDAIWNAISEIREGLLSCQNSLAELQSTAAKSLLTATEAEATAETLLTLATSNPSSEVVDALESQTTEIPLPMEINPENPPAPETPPGPTILRRKRRLL